MRFLFDQSADFRLIPHLEALGHDVTAISRNYPHGLADEDVLAIARDEQRILIVADRDFGELIFQQGLAHAGVLFFRLPGAPLPTKIEQLNRALNEYAEELHRGAFLVITNIHQEHSLLLISSPMTIKVRSISSSPMA